MRQYEDLQATFLYCSHCGSSMPVKEKLLLVLPDGYLFEYLCVNCGRALGDKKTKLKPQDRLFLR